MYWEASFLNLPYFFEAGSLPKSEAPIFQLHSHSPGQVIFLSLLPTMLGLHTFSHT